MRQFTWQYPGDPTDVCLEMNRAEFLQNFPRKPIKIYGSGGALVEEIPLQPNEIYCDSCNEDPGDAIFVIHRGSKAFCGKCAGEWVTPYELKT